MSLATARFLIKITKNTLSPVGRFPNIAGRFAPSVLGSPYGRFITTHIALRQGAFISPFRGCRVLYLAGQARFFYVVAPFPNIFWLRSRVRAIIARFYTGILVILFLEILSSWCPWPEHFLRVRGARLFITGVCSLRYFRTVWCGVDVRVWWGFSSQFPAFPLGFLFLVACF